jgi:hypothetical protein
MVWTEGVPVPCGCFLGYHHETDGSPVIEQSVVPGRHTFCVGACLVWGTPTEEFDFRLETAFRIESTQVLTRIRVIDLVNDGVSVSQGGFLQSAEPPVICCMQLGTLRKTAWLARDKTA